MLDLSVARLKAIGYAELGGIIAGLFHDTLEDTKLDAEDQSGVGGFEFPAAAEIWGNDFQIAVNGCAAVPLARAAAINNNGGTDVERNKNPRGSAKFDDTGLIGN
jgi:hypothetical protein